jgi:ankyrin repeat protein
MELYLCARNCDLQGCRRCLQMGMDPNFQNVNNAHLKTSLEVAIFRFHYDCVELLLNYGADINRISDQGYTPLHTATYTKDNHLLKILLDHGADVNIQNNNGNTALHLEFYDRPRYDIISLFINNGADIFIKNKHNKSPYDLALETCDPSIIDLLEELPFKEPEF